MRASVEMLIRRLDEIDREHGGKLLTGGIKISDGQMAAIAAQLKPDTFHGEWNYTLEPAAREKPPTRSPK